MKYNKTAELKFRRRLSVLEINLRIVKCIFHSLNKVFRHQKSPSVIWKVREEA